MLGRGRIRTYENRDGEDVGHSWDITRRGKSYMRSWKAWIRYERGGETRVIDVERWRR